MYESMEIAERLKDARKAAGFRSASEATTRFDWKGSTYASHENGTRGCKPADIQRYAQAYRADPCYIAFGSEAQRPTTAGLPDSALREVIKFVMGHEGASAASPDEIADLILDICNYVRQSGEGGLENVVDFAFHRRAARAG